MKPRDRHRNHVPRVQGPFVAPQGLGALPVAWEPEPVLGEVSLNGTSFGESGATGELLGQWTLGGPSEGVGLTGNPIPPSNTLFPSADTYPGMPDTILALTYALAGTSTGTSTTVDEAWAGRSEGSSATGYWQPPASSLYPDATLYPGLTTASLEVEDAPAVHEKVGVAVTTTLAKGADVFQATETGKAITTTLAAGTDAKEAPRVGTVTSTAGASGADVREAVEAGTATAGALATGTSTKETPGKAGVATAGSLAKGADAWTAARSATATARAALFGADVFQAVETGRALAGTKAAGTGSTEEPITFVDYVGPLVLVLNETARSLTVSDVSHSLTVAAPVRSLTVSDSAHSLTVAATVQTTMAVSEVSHGLEVDEPERAIELDEPARVLEVVP